MAVLFQIHADEKNAVDYYILGKQAETAGDFYSAVEMYKSALILNENYFDAVRGLAHAYYGLEEYSESLKYVYQAEKLDSENTDLMNLEGRILLNTGKLNEAIDIFNSVLLIEENNVEAEFGLAELDIASGRVNTAEHRYENVLLVSPESRKALLALVMINDEVGNSDNAEYYLQQALKFYSDNSFVRLTAAKHYYHTGDIDESLYHLETALFLQPDFLDASILYCSIYLDSGNYDKVIDEIESILPDNGNESILWYLLGRAYDNKKQYTKALNAYARALSIRPDEDLSRIALENILIQNMPMDSELRARYSAYHIDLGMKNEARNMLHKARTEYRRALVIDPHSVDARLLYADICRRSGYTERYLLILTTLVEEGYESVDILDEIEIQESMTAQSVSERWNINQFAIEKERIKLSIFFSNSGMSHNEGGNILSEYMEYLLMGYENINVMSNEISDDFAYCFRNARNNKSDFFIIFNFQETDRAVAIRAEIYLSSTGNKLKTIELMRTGNQMIPEAGKAVAEAVHDLLPVYGRIINRKFDEIAVNIGLKDGISDNLELLILKKGSLELSKDDFSIVYDDDAVIGTFEVDQADELISDGNINVRGFFDMINPGDLIVVPETEKENPDTEVVDDAQMFYTGNLYNSITNIK
ncbi:MAG: tetratricopeptide repeat protein [Spirochaetales bacterium]|uniref:Tetratricopeptide repeat protein n=1 Tax=Candidatus Thalassospirochaeta sargassi TaxID=3119039 RepID=A0AAJ1IFQ5_9SPIO|nr:tetratricopeptide repeat protein [Spirochaetales bacterium]